MLGELLCFKFFFPLCFRFMRQVQDETLRLSTLAPWAGRYSDKDVNVCGYLVPAGTPIIFALGVALKNKTQWKDEEKLVKVIG